MNTSLILIADISGSMSEMGKVFVLRNLFRYASQLKYIEPGKYADVSISFFQWSAEVTEVIPQEDGDIPVLLPQGSSDLDALCRFLRLKGGDGQRIRALVFSDGYFITPEIAHFQELMLSLPNLYLQTVAIGSDANLLKLQKISSDTRAHLAENISSAIESTLWGTDENLKAPLTVGQIQFAPLNDTKEAFND